jgi:hypothetical protein
MDMPATDKRTAFWENCTEADWDRFAEFAEKIRQACADARAEAEARLGSSS